ncbi:hypothetical protein Bbelb_264310 [Branchiostoma belcheri]|nr:hypothetical protein Bbelb_264310 [Branchiostoma belcheri]
MKAPPRKIKAKRRFMALDPRLSPGVANYSPIPRRLGITGAGVFPLAWGNTTPVQLQGTPDYTPGAVNCAKQSCHIVLGNKHCWVGRKHASAHGAGRTGT